MINLNKKVLLALSIICFSNMSYAGPTSAPIETAMGKAQVVIQKISTELSKLTKNDQNDENKNLGTPQENAKKEKEVKNETLVESKDGTPLTLPYLQPLLTQAEPDVTAIHKKVKENALIDYNTLYEEDKTDISLSEIAQGYSTKIKNTAAEDVLKPNTQEALQSIYHLTLEQGRAVYQKSFSLMDKNKKYKDSKKSDTEKRKTTVDMERGNAMANQNSSMILNELGLLRFSTLEINSLGEMQDKSISILGIKK